MVTQHWPGLLCSPLGVTVLGELSRRAGQSAVGAPVSGPCVLRGAVPVASSSGPSCQGGSGAADRAEPSALTTARRAPAAPPPPHPLWPFVFWVTLASGGVSG